MSLPHFKSRCNGIPLNNIVTGQQYSFSFNPESQPKTNNKQDVYKWYREQYAGFIQLKDKVNIILYPEVSNTGRYHFHGYIQIIDIHSYISLLRAMNKISSYEVDTINPDTQLVYEQYVKKQINIWEPYFKSNIIGYPLNNTKDYFNDVPTPPQKKKRIVGNKKPSTNIPPSPPNPPIPPKSPSIPDPTTESIKLLN